MRIKEKIINSLKTKNSKRTGRFQTLEEQEKVIKEKKFLKQIYMEWYKELEKEISNFSEGAFVEIGSGGGFIKEVIPNVITSDILFSPSLDINLSATMLPFKDSAVDIFFMVDALHHIQEPILFLKEASRCLKSGGKIIMIEPANTAWSRFIYKNFHHEEFDPKTSWVVDGEDPLYSANGAIPWIIFFRDRDNFQKECPFLKVNKVKFHMPLRYLISGGLSVRQLLPTAAYGIVKALENILMPFNKYIAMFQTIELEKL